jgi:23S rRNA (uracil1939-C5)-methyltransferase
MKLQIEKMVYGGAGLAHESSGRAVFVPFTLPGEVVEARLLEERGGYGEAALVQVLDASADRVGAGCAHFGECGGCQYQHARYAAQLEAKTGILRETLERAGVGALPEVQVHAGAEWGYRNRIRLRVMEIDGALRVGYSRRGGNDFLAVGECPIAGAVLWRAAEGFVDIAKEAVAARWAKAAVEVEFFAAADERSLQMAVYVRKEPGGGFGGFCEALRGVGPELVGGGVAVLPASTQQGRRMERPKAGARWGAAGLKYRVGEIDYWVSRGGFFQVNRWLVEEMVKVVTAGRAGELAWDL